MTDALVLVESNTTGTGRMFAAAARDRGLRPVLLSRRPQRYPWVEEDGVDAVVVDTADAAAVAAAAGRTGASGGPPAGIVTSSEYFVAVTAEAAGALGRPGADPAAVRRCRDKRLQRAALAAAGVPVPAFAAAATPDEAVAAAAAIGGPVVVKPVDGTGSRGVRRCVTADEVRRQAAALLAQGRDERGQPSLPAVLVEEYVDGPEFSVETFGREVVGVTAKHVGPPPWFVECGHDHPADLDAGVGAGMAVVATAALGALGLGFGAVHTEVRVGPQGPVVIEVNPRLAGGRIPVLVRLATGVDLVGATVDAAIGAAPMCAPVAAGSASIRFLVPDRAGLVRRTGGVEAAQAVPGVVEAGISCRPGQRVGGTGSFLDRVGYVIAAGPSAGAARDAAEAGLRRLELELELDDAAAAALVAVP